ncbi:hypothetical protein DH2020_039178 [Rehmannia glutinosa]|uniref:Bifunctional lysine-specific demethylase and histidyl-hydroxylase n=1 Tax=Rehmannia glutinosa TaxID=99300 RepID=A0ABR0UZ56_REHGL
MQPNLSDPVVNQRTGSFNRPHIAVESTSCNVSIDRLIRENMSQLNDTRFSRLIDCCVFAESGRLIDPNESVNRPALMSLCSKSHIRRALIKKCLNRVFLSLPQFDLSPFLSLFPSLLKFSNCTEIVCKSAEIIGAASLASFEMNENIALEDEIMKGLISLLGSSKREIAIASCNAVLDLSTTLVGRQRLLEFTAIENLLLCFIQECKSPTVCPAADMILLEKDEYPVLLLQGAITLINSCTVEQLQHIPKELSEFFSVFLKSLWVLAHKQRLCGSSSRCNQEYEFCMSNIKTNSLVESIFRLSINYGLHAGDINFEHVKKNNFYLGEVGIKPFLSEIWETSPLLIRNTLKASFEQDGIFSPFIQSLGLKEAIPTFLPSFLKRIISCPAIVSDELDILEIIKEIKNNLGYPINYNQDIRVVKTEYGERELHYFQGISDSRFSQDTHILSISDILKCEEAFKEGYSIALRGIEFRNRTISAIAEGLAYLFGQPSAGVNMYLTPSNSQGLARHSDDHCVFVCQLIGVKRWSVFPRPDFQLPRLYEPCDISRDLEDKSRKFDGCQQFLLKEGDVLYIPRGFPHEARTDEDEGFSLHLTLAVEIEPPFEWEGFMQVAVYCWATRQQKALQYKSDDSVQRSLNLVSVMLLHIAIKLIGHHDPRFRKACLVGATLSSSDTRDWLCENQRTTFGYLISTITSESKFSDAVEQLEAALRINEDPLEHVRWMKHLIVEEEEEIERYQSLSILSADSRDMFDILIRNRDIAETVFLQVKSKFCCEIEFEDVKRRYLVLLEKYRTVRKQYTNGMLSLHSALQNELEFGSNT